MEFEFNGDNAPFLQKKNTELIKVTSDDGKIIYKDLNQSTTIYLGGVAGQLSDGSINNNRINTRLY